MGKVGDAFLFDFKLIPKCGDCGYANELMRYGSVYAALMGWSAENLEAQMYESPWEWLASRRLLMPNVELLFQTTTADDIQDCDMGYPGVAKRPRQLKKTGAARTVVSLKYSGKYLQLNIDQSLFLNLPGGHVLSNFEQAFNTSPELGPAWTNSNSFAQKTGFKWLVFNLQLVRSNYTFATINAPEEMIVMRREVVTYLLAGVPRKDREGATPSKPLPAAFRKPHIKAKYLNDPNWLPRCREEAIALVLQRLIPEEQKWKRNFAQTLSTGGQLIEPYLGPEPHNWEEYQNLQVKYPDLVEIYNRRYLPGLNQVGAGADDDDNAALEEEYEDDDGNIIKRPISTAAGQLVAARPMKKATTKKKAAAATTSAAVTLSSEEEEEEQPGNEPAAGNPPVISSESEDDGAASAVTAAVPSSSEDEEVGKLIMARRKKNVKPVEAVGKRKAVKGRK
nr:hypothetical protein BaRGS_000628 [Batillaria attramentaria]